MNLEETSRIRALETSLQEHMRLFAYHLIDIPMIEKAEIFLTRAGDNIIERLFTFERFGQLLALRPEFTAAAAHRYALEGKNQTVRWQMSGAIFEDEPSDISRQYQKHTIGAEFIGESGIAADAEIVAMAAQGLDKLGIEHYELFLGHVGLLRHLLGQFELDSRTERILLSQRERLKKEGKQAVLDYLRETFSLSAEISRDIEEFETNGQTQYMLDILLDSTRYGTTMGGRSREEIAQRLLKKRQRAVKIEQILAAIDFLTDWVNLEGDASSVLSAIQSFVSAQDEIAKKLLHDWEATITLLHTYGLADSQIHLQADLAKNWDYYTGLVFGIRVKNQFVASGGRYDGLTKLLGSDEAVPAVGFAYYTDALLDVQVMTEENKLYRLSAVDNAVAIQWASALRLAGIAIEQCQENADIQIIDNKAKYSGREFSLDELVQELSK